MNFVHMDYLPWILLVFVIFTILVFFFEIRYFAWVKRYWFLKRSWINRLSTFLYLAGIFFLLLSLLDLRGKETRIKANIPDQKTVILIDASMSMKAEDVRPNRFQRSLLIAKHFVNKAVGHQISIVLFSEKQKQIVAFTDDIDFLDARLGSLENVNLDNAGTNVKQAILETVQYLREEAGSDSEVMGNILVFSDGEEHAGKLDMEIPSGVNVAFVGVGTLQGAGIPMRSGSGNYSYFDSFKKYKGEKIVTKLDEDFIRRLGSGVKNYRYWVASSYSMPTEEIIGYFRDIYKTKNSQGDVRVQPVMYEYVVIPGIILLSLGFLLTLPRTFVSILVFLGMFQLITPRIYAQDEKTEKAKQLSSRTLDYLNRLKNGELDSAAKLKLGELLLKDGKSAEAAAIYKENNTEKIGDDEAIFNYGTSELKSGNLISGVEILNNLKNRLEKRNSKKSSEMMKAIEANLALAFKNEKKKNENKKQEQQKNQDQKEQDQKQDQQNQKDQKKQQSKQDSQKKDDKKSGQQKDDNKGQSGPDKNQKDQQKPNEQDQKDQEQKKKEQEKNEKQDPKKSENSEQDKSPKNLEEKEEQIKRQRMLTKIPAVLKEIMNVDRQLQEKFLDTRTQDKSEPYESKEW